MTLLLTSFVAFPLAVWFAQTLADEWHATRPRWQPAIERRSPIRRIPQRLESAGPGARYPRANLAGRRAA